MARSTVAAVVADGLARAGTRRVFAAPGATTALLQAARARGLAVVETATVTGACVMAAVTGELDAAPGAAAVSLAGGAGAIAEGAAHAARDRAPVIIVSGAAPDAPLLAPVVKASLAPDAASAGHWIAHAAQLAMTAPCGPVHVAVDVAGASALPVATSCRRPPMPAAPADVLDALADAIVAAARPVLVTGLEVAEADATWVRALAETLPAPVLCTAKGKGALPDPHPLALGLLTPGHPLAARADLVVALGVDAAELSPGAWPAAARAAHVGHRPCSPLYRAVVEVVADIGLVIEELAPRLRGRARADWDVAELDRLKRALATPAPAGARLARHRVAAIVREATPAGTLAALDVPLAAAWQAVAPRELLIPNGVATPGFALPAALAAALARDGRRVVAIGAVSGMVPPGGELATAVRLALPIVMIALDPDGIALEPARRAGVAAWQADDEAGLRAAFARAWSAGRPALVSARVGR
jgi:acetolactate synthase-1/2/3 large subunit